MSNLRNNKGTTPIATLWLLNSNFVCDEALAFFVQKLSNSEANRCESFLRRERRRQFLLGRVLLRLTVANLTGLPVDEFDVVERPGNAPLLVLPDSRQASPNFSLSHSRNWVACAVSCDVSLGLDIEVNETARDINAISELVFHPSEYLWLLTLSHAERVSSFYELWCAREALYKLLCNLGREEDLSSLDVGNVAHELERFGWHQIIRAFPGLSIVAVSDQRFAIRERILKRVTCADWIAASRHPHSN